jgi:hypothetical protein
MKRCNLRRYARWINAQMRRGLTRAKFHKFYKTIVRLNRLRCKSNGLVIRRRRAYLKRVRAAKRAAYLRRRRALIARRRRAAYLRRVRASRKRAA